MHKCLTSTSKPGLRVQERVSPFGTSSLRFEKRMNASPVSQGCTTMQSCITGLPFWVPPALLVESLSGLQEQSCVPSVVGKSRLATRSQHRHEPTTERLAALALLAIRRC